jgi:hypothetical protein
LLQDISDLHDPITKQRRKRRTKTSKNEKGKMKKGASIDKIGEGITEPRQAKNEKKEIREKGVSIVKIVERRSERD